MIEKFCGCGTIASTWCPDCGVFFCEECDDVEGGICPDCGSCLDRILDN